MTPKENAEEILRLSKSTIRFFAKDISEKDLHLLAKQISLNQIKYTSDRVNDNSTPLDIFNIKREILEL